MVSAIPEETTRAMAAGVDGAGGVATMTVGPAEYLQWLGDLSSMLVHEQWRKEVQSMPAPKKRRPVDPPYADDLAFPTFYYVIPR